MRRSNHWIGLSVAYGLLSIGTIAVAATPVVPNRAGPPHAPPAPAKEKFIPGAVANSPSPEYLLPGATVGFLALTNFDQLDKQWKKTQVGQLFDSKPMAAFRKDLRQQMRDRWANLHDRLGLTLEDLGDVSGGEVGFGLINLVRQKEVVAATAVVADVTGHMKQAKAMLAKMTAHMAKQGAKRSTLLIGGREVVVFDLPPSTEDQLPKGQDGKTAIPTAPVPAEFVVYTLAGNLLIAADDLETVRGILGRLAGGPKGSLAEVAGFRSVMERCAKDAGKPTTHQVRWFIYPLGYAEAARAATPKDHAAGARQ